MFANKLSHEGRVMIATRLKESLAKKIYGLPMSDKLMLKLEHGSWLLRSFMGKAPKIRLMERQVGLLQFQGRKLEAIAKSRFASQRREQWLKKRIPLDSRQDEVRLIYLSGYFYSGSGAVLDYLRGLQDAIKWSPNSNEVRVVKFPGGLADLERRLKTKGQLSEKDVVDFYLHITGSFVHNSPRGVYHKQKTVNRASRRLIKNPKASGYLWELFQLFHKLDEFAGKPQQDVDEFGDLCRHHLKLALQAAASNNQANIILADQIATAWRIPIAKLLPPGTFVVVHRDPRDQFVEARQALSRPGRKPWTAKKFTKVYVRRRKLVQDSIAKLTEKYGHRFIQVCFEDFVVNHEETAARLVRELGLEGLPYSEEQRNFWPEKSRKNVGKHKGVLTDEELHMLRTSLGEYFHPAAD